MKKNNITTYKIVVSEVWMVKLKQKQINKKNEIKKRWVDVTSGSKACDRKNISLFTLYGNKILNSANEKSIPWQRPEANLHILSFRDCDRIQNIQE